MKGMFPALILVAAAVMLVTGTSAVDAVPTVAELQSQISSLLEGQPQQDRVDQKVQELIEAVRNEDAAADDMVKKTLKLRVDMLEDENRDLKDEINDAKHYLTKSIQYQLGDTMLVIGELPPVNRDGNDADSFRISLYSYDTERVHAHIGVLHCMSNHVFSEYEFNAWKAEDRSRAHMEHRKYYDINTHKECDFIGPGRSFEYGLDLTDEFAVGDYMFRVEAQIGEPTVWRYEIPFSIVGLPGDGTSDARMPQVISGNVITLAAGSKILGCEDTVAGCFIPRMLAVDAGDTVTIRNTDNVVHTAVSGTLKGGVDGHFYSGLALPGTSFEWTPTRAGDYPYFCLIHPWMEGLIRVNGDVTPGEEVPEPLPKKVKPNDIVRMTPSETGQGNVIIQALGSGILGCEDTATGCFTPKIVRVNVGEKVTIKNADNVAHTAVSGTLEDGPDEIFDSGLALPGTSFEWTPTRTGDYPYFCLIHPWMAGMISVV